MARCSVQVRKLEHDLPAVQALERSRGVGGRIRHVGRDRGRQRPLCAAIAKPQQFDVTMPTLSYLSGTASL